MAFSRRISFVSLSTGRSLAVSGSEGVCPDGAGPVWGGSSAEKIATLEVTVDARLTRDGVIVGFLIRRSMVGVDLDAEWIEVSVMKKVEKGELMVEGKRSDG